jgi:hypothetical protein
MTRAPQYFLFRYARLGRSYAFPNSTTDATKMRLLRSMAPLPPSIPKNTMTQRDY